VPILTTGEKAKTRNAHDGHFCGVEQAAELATFAGKVAAGTATKEDKARLRKLAAKV